MKKRLRIGLLAMFVMLWNIATISLAANEQVIMTSSKNDVKSGDTFEIIVSQESEGLTGFESTLSYDTNVFSLTKKEFGTGWIDIGNETKLDAMANSAISSGEIFKLTFSVKENVASTTSEIKLTGIKLYRTSSDKTDLGDKSVSINVNSSSNNDNNNDDNNQTQVTLSKIEVTKAPNTTNYKEGEQFNANGMEVTATYSDNSTKRVTNYTYSPNTALKTENKLVTISYTENGVTKSTTQAINVSAATNNNGNNNNNTNTNMQSNNTSNTNRTSNNITNNTNVTNVSNNTTDNTTTGSNLPKTGSRTKYILVIVAALIGIAFVAYKEYQKYKEI